MEMIMGCCAGLDVHKDGVEACVRRLEEGGKVQQETRHWGTLTRELLAMADWLAAAGVSHVAMESTGVYWKPIFNNSGESQLLQHGLHPILIQAAWDAVKKWRYRPYLLNGEPVDVETSITVKFHM